MAKKKAKKTAKKSVKKAAPKKAAKKAAKKKSAKPAKKKAAKKSAPKKQAAAPKKRFTSINPYLTFQGSCEDAFNFYRSVFGGNFTFMGRFGEMPPMEGQPPMPESERNKIMHVSLPISEETILMGSDTMEGTNHTHKVGDNFSISINAASQPEADRLYNGLAAGGQQTMPMSKTFWGSYFGMLTDKYGIQWMVSFDEKPMN
jgi:PhnB protein